MRALVKKILRYLRFELIRLNDEEVRKLETHPTYSYTEITLERALTVPALSSGELTLSETKFLMDIIGELTVPGPIIEIGTLFGSSARAIVLAKEQERALICVDAYCWNPLRLPPELHFQITEKLLREAQEKYNLCLIREDKNEFYNNYNGERPALVYLDAVHTYDETKKDIEWAKSIGAHVICGHDYDEDKYPDVVTLINEYGGTSRREERLWVL